MNYNFFTTINNEKQRKRLIALLKNKIGLPEITYKMSIYSTNEAGDELNVHFDGKLIQFNYKPRTSNQGLDYERRRVNLKNNNIKEFLHYMEELGFKKAHIGELVKLKYQNPEYVLHISYDSFIGDYVNVETSTKSGLEEFAEYAESIGLTVSNQKKKADLTKSIKLEREEIFNKYGVLNSLILEFANKVGLDIRSGENTIRDRLKNHSNNYSHFETSYNEVTGSQLLTTNSLSESLKLPPTTITICSYNSENTILKAVMAINMQKLTKEEFGNLELIIVDDGSKIPVKTTLEPLLNKLNFKYKIIRLENNIGLSSARNIGFAGSNSAVRISIDSDILIPPNYVREHAIRSYMISNAIFVSFKQNINNDDPICSLENINKGLKIPDKITDLRVSRHVKKSAVGISKLENDKYIEILADTQYFKDLGYGRQLGIFDLSCMLIGHNFTFNKALVGNSIPFSTEFVGWGLDDTYFGAKSVASGNFLIPVLSTSVYHIDHAPRSGCQSKKDKELKTNLMTLDKILDREITT